MLHPLRFKVYTKTFGPVGAVSTPREAHVVLRHNLPSSCSFTLDDDHRLVAALGTPGARVVAEYRVDGVWLHLISGVVSVEGVTTGDSSTRTYTVADDKGLLWSLLGWPNPSGSIVEQGDEDAYYTSTGAAETVVKALVSANMGHVATPLTVTSDSARGGAVSVSVRMHPLADRLFPAVDLAGIGVDVRQSGAGVVLDVYEPADRTSEPPLTEASGAVVEARFSVSPPTVTRVTVAGPGEGLARAFAEVADTAAEAAWGVSIEQARDARDLDEESPTLTDELEARGQQTLAEGASATSLSARLAETDHFRAGVAYWIGDLLPVQPLGAPVLQERVRAIEFDLTPTDGLVITPRLGLDNTFESVTTRHIATLARAVRDQIVGR